MKPRTTIAVFVAGLAATFAVAYTVGWTASPDERSSSHHSASGNDSATAPGGVLVSDRGYTLQVVTADSHTVGFRIVDRKGASVTRFDTMHDKKLHLIAVRRDMSNYRHVHPSMTPDGMWSVPAPFGEPGSYRIFADFAIPHGPALTLGADVNLPGEFAPRPLPAPSNRATSHGYTVTMTGALTTGKPSKLTFAVARDGSPTSDLQPYLGAYGHLVALREGDLAYLHVHPEGSPNDGTTKPGPQVPFVAEVPSPGTYRLFLEFQHQGEVHTVEFTATATATDQPSAQAPHVMPPMPMDEHSGHSGHMS